MIIMLTLAALLLLNDEALGMLVTEQPFEQQSCLCYRDGAPIFFASPESLPAPSRSRRG